MIIDRTNEYLERLERAAMAPSSLANARRTINAAAGRAVFEDITDPRIVEAAGKLRAWSDRLTYGTPTPYSWSWLRNNSR